MDDGIDPELAEDSTYCRTTSIDSDGLIVLQPKPASELPATGKAAATDQEADGGVLCEHTADSGTEETVASNYQDRVHAGKPRPWLGTSVSVSLPGYAQRQVLADLSLSTGRPYQ